MNKSNPSSLAGFWKTAMTIEPKKVKMMAKNGIIKNPCIAAKGELVSKCIG